jgi:hypothetical protein
MQQSSNSLAHQHTHSIPQYSAALHSLIILLITSRHRPHRKHISSVAVSIVACVASGVDGAENTSFQPVHWRVKNLLPSNGRCLQSHNLSTGLHAAIYKLQFIATTASQLKLTCVKEVTLCHETHFLSH